MGHNVALILAAAFCAAIWWTWRLLFDKPDDAPSPTPPVPPALDAFPQVEDVPEAPPARQGRVSAPRVEYGLDGRPYAWIRPDAGDDDDD